MALIATFLLAFLHGATDVPSATSAVQTLQSAEPTGTVVHVSTEAELQAAAARLASNTTIVLAAGTYPLTATLRIAGPLKDVAIRGATSNANDVVLVGAGMTNPDPGARQHGISVSGRVQGITIANLTIRDVSNAALVFETGVQAPRLHNLRILDAGGRFLRSDRGVDGGSVEDSTIEYTTASAGSAAGGIEVAGGGGWKIRRNLFRNIRALSGQLSAPAILVWQGSRDSIVEANTFINCQREIAFGLDRRPGYDHSGGIIRNNFVYREPSLHADASVRIVDSPGTQVLHNTILASGTYPSLIESRFATAARVVIRNNLLDGQIAAVDGAKPVVGSNYTTASADMFANAAAGDLHLVARAVAVIDAVEALPGADTDVDGEPRPQGRAADYGADEVAGGETTSVSAATAPAQAIQTDRSLTTAVSAAEAGNALPDPWQTLDIGSPPIEGTARYLSGVFAVLGGGADIGGHADQFRFVYQTLDGDGEIIVRVLNLVRTHPWAKAGVMIRDELNAGARNVLAAVTAGNGIVFQRRLAENGPTLQRIARPGAVPYWLRLTRTGNTFTAYGSTDGSTWSVLGVETVPMNRLVHVGLAVTSHSSYSLTTAVFTDVRVESASAHENALPRVSIMSPSSGSTFPSPATVNISAEASDPDGVVSRVDFHAGSKLIASSTQSPFKATWNDAPAGTHRLTAVAHDDSGASARSEAVEITVLGNQPPTVSLTSPPSDSIFTAPASIAVAASASDSDGTISKVEFYAGSTPIGSDSTSPFSVNWSVAQAGTYTLSAKAWDNAGASTISGGVNVTVRPPNQPPTVSLTSPSSGSTFLAPATISLAANASDADGAVARVDFYAGSTLVGSDASSPYGTTWSNVPAGSYSLTAVARDNNGSTSTSAPVAITVTTSTSTAPRAVAFTPSVDHDTLVVSYAIEFYAEGATPGATPPVRTQNVGKPAPVNGEILVDVSATVQALAPGRYFVVVAAIGTGGTSRSARSEVFPR